MKQKKILGKKSLPAYLQITSAGIILISSVAIALPSLAEDNSSTNQSAAATELARTDSTALSSSLDIQVQNITSQTQSCGDISNAEGLAAAQKAAYTDRITMAGAVTNTDKIFDVTSNGGCFNALKNFPNLSVAIPSLSSIGAALQKTLLDYATRKVCNAVNDALGEVINPINETMAKISKSGQIDMTGTFNNKINEELYKIDPELGRVSTPAQTDYSWGVSADQVNLDGIGSVLGSSTSTNNNNSSDSSTNTNTTNMDTTSTAKSEATATESNNSVISSFFK